MPYKMTRWKDERPDGEPKFQISSATIQIVDADIAMTTPLLEAGTPYTAARMNKLERGIFDNASGLAGSSNQTRKTEFLADGSIRETITDSATSAVIATLLTEFLSDGSIRETYTCDGITMIKTTSFNSDGSISEVIA